MKSCGFAVTGIGVTLASILATSPIAAQARSEGRGVRVLPATPRTPYGLCRIWINDLPSARQPAATGCAYAYSNAPRNGRVIYGGERGELFSRSDPYYYDRDARNRDYDERDYRDSYSRDSYRYSSRYRRDADDRDRSNWRYRTDDRYGSSGYSRRHRDGGDESSGWSGRDGYRGGHQSGHDRGNGKGHGHGNGGSSGTGHGRWK